MLHVHLRLCLLPSLDPHDLLPQILVNQVVSTSPLASNPTDLIVLDPPVSIAESSPSHTLASSPTHLHHMITRSQLNIFKPKIHIDGMVKYHLP
jgi:hypothetical protein